MIFFVGDAPVLTASFENEVGPANPTTVTFYVRKVHPVAGNTVTYISPNVENVATGEYELGLPILTEDDVGIWKFVAEGIGAVEAGSNDSRFEVRPTLVPRP